MQAAAGGHKHIMRYHNPEDHSLTVNNLKVIPTFCVYQSTTFHISSHTQPHVNRSTESLDY